MKIAAAAAPVVVAAIEHEMVVDVLFVAVLFANDDVEDDGYGLNLFAFYSY